jgi:hypothetical protein
MLYGIDPKGLGSRYLKGIGARRRNAILLCRLPEYLVLQENPPLALSFVILVQFYVSLYLCFTPWHIYTLSYQGEVRNAIYKSDTKGVRFGEAKWGEFRWIASCWTIE